MVTAGLLLVLIALNDSNFDSCEELQKLFDEKLDRLQNQQILFQGIHKLADIWTRCVASEGNYQVTEKDTFICIGLVYFLQNVNPIVKFTSLYI